MPELFNYVLLSHTQRARQRGVQRGLRDGSDEPRPAERAGGGDTGGATEGGEAEGGVGGDAGQVIQGHRGAVQDQEGSQRAALAAEGHDAGKHRDP